MMGAKRTNCIRRSSAGIDIGREIVLGMRFSIAVALVNGAALENMISDAPPENN
jgi:hypothetical protein